MECSFHNIIHKNTHVTQGHDGCMQHGYCLNTACCPLFKTCPCNVCLYHKIIHTKIEFDKNVGHIGCMHHGHCLNPTCCPLFKTCPCNVCL